MHKDHSPIEFTDSRGDMSLMVEKLPTSKSVDAGAKKIVQSSTDGVLDIIAEVLKIRKEKIDLQADFDELGMDSVLIYSFINELEKRQINIPMHELMSCKNIAELTILFQEKEKGLVVNLEKHWDVLKRSEINNTSKSTVVIPGTPGISFPYASMAQSYRTKGQVIGLNWKGVFDHQPFQTIEEVAQFNLEQIKQNCANQSIDLIGHSYGALIVYEMLKHTEQMGVNIDKVILIDSSPKLLAKTRTEKQLLLMLLDAFGWNETQISPEQLVDIVETMVQKTMDEKIVYFQSIQSMLDDSKAPQILNEDLTASIFHSYMTTMSIKYKPKKKINKKVTVIKAKIDNVVNMEDLSQGWQKLFEEVEVIHAEGDHYTIIQKGNCDQWISQLKQQEQISNNQNILLK